MNEIRHAKQKLYITDLLILLFEFIIGLIPFLYFGVAGTDPICLLTFFINGIVFIFGMFSAYKKYSISLELVYWIFMFFFMYFAPSVQYLTSAYPWRGSLTDSDVVAANLLILLFNVSFMFGEYAARRFKIKGVSAPDITDFLCGSFEFSKRTKIIMTSIVCLLAVYSFSRTGLMEIVVSRVQATQVFYSGGNSAIEMIVESVVPAFMAYVVTEAAQSMIAKKENGLRFFVLLVALLICFFPTSLPRYKTITIYGTIFLVLFPKLRKGSKFFLVFVAALFFAFPMMNSFRHILSMESFASVFEDGFLSVYIEADYDAYRMLSSAIKYTGNNGIRWGYQLLGVFLFFVPSAIWGSKPGGSGAMLIRAEFGKNTVSNVSCPFIAEGYLNFGFVGVIVFALFLGITVRKMDMGYWRINKDKDYVAFSPYLFMVFMVFFMLRGDLLSSFAYICGFVITGYLIRLIADHT